MRAVRRPPTRSVARDIDEQTIVGEVLMRSLVRTQRRLAVATLTAFALTVGALPVLFALAPALRTAQVLVVPVPWLLLGLLVYPFVVGVAWAYVRAAEGAERDFSDLVDRR
jgi:hypothetical protein